MPFQKEYKEYEWNEVKEHNNEKSAWVCDNDEIYDVTSFVDHHPGGRDMLLLMAGRDITNVFRSYHPFTDKPAQILQQYKIGKLKGGSEFGTFNKDSGFYSTLCQRVGKYFKDNNIDYKSPLRGFLNYILIMSIMFTTWYYAFILHDLPFRHRVYLLIIAGIFQGMLLVHTMHDCSHTSLSHSPFIWKWLGRICMDVTCGTSFDAWLHQHVVGHHVYTNILKVDPDLPMTDDNDMRRVTPLQQWASRYSLQYAYLPILYCLYAFKSRIQDITDTLLGGQNGAIRVNPKFRNYQSLIRQIIGKSLWFTRAVIIPLYYFQNKFWTEFLPLFLIMELSTGYFLTFNFQVSHISTEADWPQPKLDPSSNKWIINGEWAKLQIETSVDYGHGSSFWAFFSGALNYQSVHHLFPSVSQYHYPAIANIVKDTCKEFNVKFNHVANFGQAFQLHLKQLYEMSFPNSEQPQK